MWYFISGFALGFYVMFVISGLLFIWFLVNENKDKQTQSPELTSIPVKSLTEAQREIAIKKPYVILHEKETIH